MAGHHPEEFKITELGNWSINPRMVIARRYDRPIRAFLIDRGLQVDEATFEKMRHEVRRALRQVHETLGRHAEGDYRPDPDAGRFPPAKIIRHALTSAEERKARTRVSLAPPLQHKAATLLARLPSAGTRRAMAGCPTPTRFAGQLNLRRKVHHAMDLNRATSWGQARRFGVTARTKTINAPGCLHAYSGLSCSSLPLNKSRASLAPSSVKVAGPASSGALPRLLCCSISSTSIFISAISLT